MDFEDKMCDQGKERVNRSLRTTINKFFKKYPDYAESCIFRKDWDGREYTLIIEDSLMWSALNGEYGWDIYTAWHKAFDGCEYYPEMQNSCVVNFWKN